MAELSKPGTAGLQLQTNNYIQQGECTITIEVTGNGFITTNQIDFAGIIVAEIG